jgi:hypothetical protein
MLSEETWTELLNPKPTPEAITERFNAELAELQMTISDLATHMDKNRDNRDFSAAIRSIQRMVSGDTRVSGEMLVIVNMLLRQRRRLRVKYQNLKWNINNNDAYCAQIEDWYVHIEPKTKGRWLVSCRHGKDPKGYSPPFGRWLNSIEEAKDKALYFVEEGMNDEADSLAYAQASSV